MKKEVDIINSIPVVKRKVGRPKGLTKEVLKAKETSPDYSKSHVGIKKRDVIIGKLKAKGQGYKSIGRVVGLSKSRVQTICHREDVKSIIEAESARLASFVPKAVSNMEHWINNAQIAKDGVDKRISYDATKELLQSTGILNNQPSHLVQILYNDNKTIINPIIKGLLDSFIERMNNVEVIDADFEEVKEIPNS